MNVALAGPRGVEPEAQETVLPDGGGGIVGAGDQPGVGRADRLPGQGLSHPHLLLAAVVEADVGVLAVELVGAEPGADARTRGLSVLTLAEAKHPAGILPGRLEKGF